MGGPGSGTWYRWNAKDTVDGRRSIDVRRWQREGFLRPGRWFGWGWWRDGEQQASIGVTAGEGWVELRYTLRPDTADAESVQYRVPLDWTACTLGGRRPWFRCPAARDGVPCMRRVAKLYLGARYFLCRRCLDLVYESQHEDAKGRAVLKAQKIRVRLGGRAGLIHDFPAKPKHMRWKTYRRLRDASEEAEMLSWVLLGDWLARSDRRIDRIVAKGAKTRRGRR